MRLTIPGEQLFLIKKYILVVVCLLKGMTKQLP